MDSLGGILSNSRHGYAVEHRSRSLALEPFKQGVTEVAQHHKCHVGIDIEYNFKTKHEYESRNCAAEAVETCDSEHCKQVACGNFSGSGAQHHASGRECHNERNCGDEYPYKVCAVILHFADSKTCVLHPASTTHRQLTDNQLEEAGVKSDLIRLSVGIEDVEDIIADIQQALEEATK